MVAASEHEIFVRGQTGASLDGKSMAGPGRQPEDAAAQAERALSNLALLLQEAGSGMDDVAKITVYISDRAYRPAVYPVIGKHFRGIHPVSTGIIVPGFARPDILFEIDAQVHRKHAGATAHARASVSFECRALWHAAAAAQLRLLHGGARRPSRDPARPDRRRPQRSHARPR